MKTKIKVYKGGWIRLLTDEPELKDLVLMDCGSFCQNRHYQIWDFRYARQSSPDVFGDRDDMEVILVEEKYLNQVVGLFNFPFTQEENKLYWFKNDGILLAGCDRPYHLQTEILKRERFVWSYAAVREKLREAKVFYENLEFNGDWQVVKREHLDKNPSYYEMKMRIEGYIKQLSKEI